MSTSLETLDIDFDGEVIKPGHPEYDTASRTIFATGSPAYVLRPANRHDVQAAIRFAASTELALSVRGGGHAFQGFGTNDEGVVIDLSRLADVEIVDAQLHHVRIGGGATWGQVATALAPLGLAISSGDTRNVGVGGLTLSGGIGWKVRKYGLTLDNLVGAEVVLANGQLVNTSADERPELFWALRGGGGNFGVVTAFEFVAHPTTDVFHGKITFPAAEATSVLQGWADHLRSAPDELTSLAILANPVAGGPQAAVEIHLTIDSDIPETADELLAPVRRLGTVLGDDIALKPYDATLEDGGPVPPGIRFVARSAFVDPESVPAALAVLADASVSEGSPIIRIHSLGGAVSRVPDDATAYAYRKAELVVVAMTAGPEAVVERARSGLDAVWRQLAPHVRGAYANFLTNATDTETAAIYPIETRRRLADVKSRYDPQNLFAGNHNITPSSEQTRNLLP